MKSDLLKHKKNSNLSTAKENLQRLQSLPLEQKILLTERRIKEFSDYYNGNVYISFSGGKDSTVLLYLVRKTLPKLLVPAVFVNTGLEYPEIVDFVRTIEEVIELRPKMPFNKVIEKYGYPVVSKEVSQKLDEIRNTKSDKLKNKRLYGDEKGNGKIPEKWKYLIKAPFKISNKCCNVMKKQPVKAFEKETGRKPFVGTMAYESRLREQQYLQNGCNSFNDTRPMSTPLSFWTDKDVYDFIEKYKLKYSSIYNMGYERTGCMFCMFGCHLEKENRFQRMKKTHQKQYNYCMDKLRLKEVLEFINNEENLC